MLYSIWEFDILKKGYGIRYGDTYEGTPVTPYSKTRCSNGGRGRVVVTVTEGILFHGCNGESPMMSASTDYHFQFSRLLMMAKGFNARRPWTMVE
jgi:hypothetical protein